MAYKLSTRRESNDFKFNVDYVCRGKKLRFYLHYTIAWCATLKKNSRIHFHTHLCGCKVQKRMNASKRRKFYSVTMVMRAERHEWLTGKSTGYWTIPINNPMRWGEFIQILTLENGDMIFLRVEMTAFELKRITFCCGWWEVVFNCKISQTRRRLEWKMEV